VYIRIVERLAILTGDSTTRLGQVFPILPTRPGPVGPVPRQPAELADLHRRYLPWALPSCEHGQRRRRTGLGRLVLVLTLTWPPPLVKGCGRSPPG
jgi:hypothetical protein